MPSRFRFVAWGLVLLSTVLLFTSCGGSDGGGDDKPVADLGVLGKGTDAFGTYASTDNTLSQVLDVQALYRDNMLELDDNVEESTFQTTSGRTITEYSSSFGASVGLSGSYKFFSASIKTNFSQSHYQNEEYSFVTKKELVKKKAKKVQNQYRSVQVLAEYLTPEFVEALDTWTPAEIFAAYGTHVMVGVYEGARLDYSMSIKIESSQYLSSLGVFADASFKGLFASAEVTSSLTTAERSAFESYTKNTTLDVKGGISQLSNCTSANPDFCDQQRLAWLDSIDENPVFCSIMQDGIIPVWEFASDQKAEEIRQYYKQYALGKNYGFPRFEEFPSTVLDLSTGLMWAKKVCPGTGGLGDLHCPDATFTWTNTADGNYYNQDGTLFTLLLYHSNNTLRTGGFSDWRIPEISELQGLLNDSYAPLRIHPMFGMTTGNRYWWSATTAPLSQADGCFADEEMCLNFSVWTVDFLNGATMWFGKNTQDLAAPGSTFGGMIVRDAL